MATRSECEREAREAAANLVLSTVLPHSVRMGTRVLETLDDMREILSYDSIGCKQALPIFEEPSRPARSPRVKTTRRQTWSIAWWSGWIAAKPPRTRP